MLELTDASAKEPIRLPPKNLDIDDSEFVVALGFGSTTKEGKKPTKLQQAADLQVVTRKFCSEDDVWGGVIKDEMLCAYGFGNGQDTCRGTIANFQDIINVLEYVIQYFESDSMAFFKQPAIVVVWLNS